jgi:hypothetical protein
VDEGVPRASEGSASGCAGRAGRRGFGMAPAGLGAGVRLPRAAAAMEVGTGAGDAAMELGMARRPGRVLVSGCLELPQQWK